MPIVSISKIQHRYGLAENLPQLSAAELGWAIDARKLYIGNGPTSEGAPEIGNTEILTEYSDLFSVAASYEYKGNAAGYTHITGVDANNPSLRTLQDKLDDAVSVRDFGAVGDGVTDDTAAINRAFFQLFCRETNEEIRRSLLFPAGVYIVSDTVKIPTYAKVFGEGKNSTIIRQTTLNPCARTADSKQQVGANIGNNGAVIPSYIEVNDLTFENTENSDVFIINSTQNSIFRRVAFKGSRTTAPSTASPSYSSVSLFSTAVNQSRNIVFEQCGFLNNNFGIVADDDMQSILINSGKFENLFKGVKLGELTSGSGASVNGPKNIKITNSFFDNIYDIGLHVYAVNDIVSAFNYYKEVGNQLNGASNPTANVISFGENGNTSLCDVFDRDDADNETFARINFNGYTSYAVNVNDAIYYGRSKTLPGNQVSLLDNTTNGSSGITFDATSEKTNLVYYTASRGSNVRQGVMKITASSSGSTLTDEFNEDGADLGIEFNLLVSAGVTTLRYTTTSTGNNVTFKYKIERLI